MRLYISGPMTGMPDHNFPAFNAAAERLTALGYEVENPAEKGIVDGWSWSDYLRYDLAKLVECDGVALLGRWRESKGARLEYSVSVELGMVSGAVGFWLTQRNDAGVTVTKPDMGRATSHALVEVRTVLSRAETALKWNHFDPERAELVIREGDWNPRSPDAGEQGYVGRETLTPHPEVAKMREALEEVVRLLSRWRRTGRPKK